MIPLVTCFRKESAEFALRKLLRRCSSAVMLAATLLPVAFEARAQQQTFHAATDLVTLTATVLNKKGARVTNLRKDDFTVLEEGASQQIEFFSSDEQAPLTAAVVIDTSGSMVDKLDDVKDAVKHFIAATRSQDEVSLIRFDDTVELLVDADEPRERTLRAIDRLRAGGGTALYDALLEGLTTVGQGTQRKKAVLLVTDGNDTSSQSGLREATEATVKSEVLVYCLGIGHGERGSFGHDFFGHPDSVDIGVLQKLSDPTGGRSFLLEGAHRSGVDQIDQAVQEIGRELRQQYSLGYYPTNTKKDGRYRRIQVKTSNPQYTVRTRKGYWAPEPSS